VQEGETLDYESTAAELQALCLDQRLSRFEQGTNPESIPGLPQPLSISTSKRLYFPNTVQGGVNAVAHRGKFISDAAEEIGNLKEKVVGAVDQRLVADAHRLDTEASAPDLSVAFLLPISLADITSFFTTPRRFGET